MHNIVQKLNTLKQESSRLAKIDLLKDYLEDEQFRIFVEMTLDETLHYNIKTLPQDAALQPNPDFYELIDYLFFLSKKQGANLQEKRKLASFCIDDDWEMVITRIINKDLRCGAGPKVINAAAPGSITVFPYLGCCTSKKKNNLNFPAICQEKEDGLFVNIFHNKHKTSFFTRNGNELIFPEDSLKDQIARNFPRTGESLVYMGELRIRIDGKYLPRKTGNGVVNKALKKNQTMSEGESLKAHFICWDVVPETNFWLCKYTKHYSERLNDLNFLLHTNATRCHLVKTIVINSFDEAQKWAQKIIANNGEGVIVKNEDAEWSDVHSTVQIKLKAGDLGIDNERECELRVIGWKYGRKGTKFENCLGKLVCVSEDDLLETNVGGGFSELERGFLGWTVLKEPVIIDNFETWIDNTYLDEIITAGFNEVIKAKTSKKHSLFSARFKEIRHDRREADTLERIKEQ